MCTCINFKTKDTYFGRTMDLDYNFGEKIVITPKNYKFDLKNGETIFTKYGMIGTATIMEGYPLYAEACNEKGLAMAALNFPNSASFFEPKDEKINLTTYELFPFLLGKLETVEEVKEMINNLNITNIPFSDNVPVTDLHWMISDEKDCIVIEQTENGVKFYENSVGVLTNNPPFNYQLTNLTNYMNLSPDVAENRFSQKLKLEPYGLGMGAIGLPGDNSPESRFIRTAFNKLNSICKDNEECSVTQFFHILDSASVVEGTTITDKGTCYMTTYSSCINITKGILYYKTYKNNQITAIRMKEQVYSNGLTSYDLVNCQQIRYLN